MDKTVSAGKTCCRYDLGKYRIKACHFCHREIGLSKSNRSKTFCVVPWVQIATNATGNYRICCNGIPGKNLVLDNNKKPMKVVDHKVEDVWNSQSYQSLRELLLNGQRPEMCERCFREEDSGVESARQKWNKKWTSNGEDSAQPGFDVKYIDLRLGNLCNLKCRMCNPYASSKWVDEWNEVAGTAELVPNNSLSENEAARLKSIDWQDTELAWKNLSAALSTVEEIYLTGGEPLLSLKQVGFLGSVVESGHSKNMKLKYNTNLTVLPEKLFRLWPEFKHVQLNVSIDGVGKLDEYIRHPTKWSVVEKNLLLIDQLEKENQDTISWGVHSTIQMYNIMHLPEILSYFSSHFQKIPYFNLLNHPKCLNIRTLPLGLKEKVIRSLEPWMHMSEVQEVASYMNAEDWHPQYFNEFLSYSRAMDRSRNQNLLDLNPDFMDKMMSPRNEQVVD